MQRDRIANLSFLLLAMLAAAGFVASAAFHGLACLQIPPPGGRVSFALHVGLFVLWFPLVILATRTRPPAAIANADHVLAALPLWSRIAIGCLFAYAILNFIHFNFASARYPRNAVPLPVTLRGFSGHWMFFYAAAWTGFVGLARLSRKPRGDRPPA
ncbi:MAG TPA: hypothetical protein VNC50_06385 [Planctomycetia bacterium]|nr:hypothetical protein [Planctomycetia bacterium]